jgi:hypothetical protein
MSQKVTVSIPNEVTGFFNCPNPSSHIMTLGLIQSPTEMSTTGGKGRSACMADNLTAICVPTV